MQGRACAFDLLRNPATKRVTLADSSAESLEAAKRFLKSSKLKTAVLDASDLAAAKKLAKDADVLVSCVPYFFNLGLAKTAVAAKRHFVDLGGNTGIVLKELALDKEARRAGVTVIPDVGLGPGMINTIAVDGMSKIDFPQEVYIRDGGLPQKPRPPMNYLLTFSEHGLINEYVEPATALRNGRRVEVPGLSEVEEIEIPGLGTLEAAHAAGGLSTMAWTFAGRVKTMDNKCLRYPGHFAVISAMNAMGFFDKKARRLNGFDIAPRDLAAKLFREHFDRPGDKDIVVIRVTVKGKHNGKNAAIVYDMLDKYDDKHKMTAMTRTTGFPASIVAQMLATKVIDKPGAFPVETGVPAAPFLDEARKRGFNLAWKTCFLE